MKRSRGRKNRGRRLGAVLAGLLTSMCLVSGAAAAPAETFTVTYKTNAGVEMGTITYEVDGNANGFPAANQFGTHFGSFWTLANQGGDVIVPTEPWYEDAAFTQKASFPAGQAGAHYTVYCKMGINLSFQGMLATSVEKSYANVFSSIGVMLGGSFYGEKNDLYDNTKLVFEKKVEDSWVKVDDSYYTNGYDGSVWPNVIFMRGVADSGTYRLKHVVYTAKDNRGNPLYYDHAYGPAGETYTVSVLPVALTLDGVQAVNRTYDGTDKVALTGGTLNGVLNGDDVSFALGQGVVDNAGAGAQKAVTTNIVLTGTKAENYTLTQPTGLSVNIAKAQAEAPEGLAVTNAAAGLQNGAIRGLKAGMEYRRQGETAWTAVTADMELTSLAPGVYEIRYQGDENHEPSAVFTATVQQEALQEEPTQSENDAVQTGDGAMGPLWLGSALAALIGAGVTAAHRKKRAS